MSLLKPVLALITGIGAVIAASAAGAVEYTQARSDGSSIVFAYQQMGARVEGRFHKLSARLSFDPAKPTAARVTLDVDLASVDTGSIEADQELAGKPWFNIRDFPTARFVSDSVKVLGGNRYEVAGKLTIKGRTMDVKVPTTVIAQGGSAVFDGAFTIRRSDFAVGEGIWSGFDVVANDVWIKFHLVAAGN